MLKLMRIPRAANRNRTLKQRLGDPLEGGRDVERLFRRFWREQHPGRAAAPTLLSGELACE